MRKMFAVLPAILLVLCLASCGEGADSGDVSSGAAGYYNGFYRYLDTLTLDPRAPASMDSLLTNVGLTGKNMTASIINNTSGYEGWIYEDDLLIFVWTGQNPTMFGNMKTKVQTLLGGTIVNSSYSTSNSVSVWTFEYGEYICELSLYTNDVSEGGIILPAGTMTLEFYCDDSGGSGFRYGYGIPDADILAVVGLTGKLAAMDSITNTSGYWGWRYSVEEGLILYWDDQDEYAFGKIDDMVYDMLYSSHDSWDENIYEDILWNYYAYGGNKFVCDLTLYFYDNSIELWFTNYDSYPYH